MQKSKTLITPKHISHKKKTSQSRKKRIATSTMNKNHRRQRGLSLKISGR